MIPIVCAVAAVAALLALLTTRAIRALGGVLGTIVSLLVFGDLRPSQEESPPPRLRAAPTRSAPIHLTAEHSVSTSFRELDPVAAALARHDRRIQALEGHLFHLPEWSHVTSSERVAHLDPGVHRIHQSTGSWLNRPSA